MGGKLKAAEVIDLLRLVPLPGEGGFYRQTWAPGDSDAPVATAIFYLVTPESFSALHKLGADEMFHFYAGDACTMIMIGEGGAVEHVVLGSDLGAGEQPQHLVPAGTWQGTRLRAGGSWALLGTTMTPGFTPRMFTLISTEVMQSWSAETQAAVQLFLPPGDVQVGQM
jgi:predicted cupin superfamily sugar epimerase